jgi:hypothetical protein
VSIGRRRALERLEAYSLQVEEHLLKITNDPDDRSAAHWIHEVQSWLTQMDDLVRHVGGKTGAAWSARIETWQFHLARSSDAQKNQH